MMGLFSQAGATLRGTAKPRADEDKAPEDTEPDDTSILDEDEGSIILSLISQLRVGMDLSRVTFPTFVLEPRSMLERITDFMSHPELVFGAETCPDPEERFIRVLQYYLAGWHLKPKGVKKPYNPILGEFFRCRYDYPDGSQGFYVAEQVSHHPPISAFFYLSPANRVHIVGELRPKSKFLGNSVSTTMEGENRVTLLGTGDGEYVITMPNMYARGILFGKMVLELGEQCTARNETTKMAADIEFKTKGFFSGTYNAIAGKVRHNAAEVGDVSGRWSHTMEFKTAKTGKKRVLFDAVKDGSKIATKQVAAEEDQEANESRRLWAALTRAIAAKDMEAATDAKSNVENAQREARKKLEESGAKHVPRFFRLKDGRWEPTFVVDVAQLDNAPAKVQEWIWGTSPLPPPPRTQTQAQTPPRKSADQAPLISL
ncbi:hypothetical protein MIND_00427500 [Mycena indigotica]|uniref:Oxysterol-binding protein n=1 Tax=Mycena indigotica TaxID=2126181 RepID=A0A8H6W987_9AGAR|nr:uncharacterized protein MIND_00427500 [Mycena indigotica]KAF7306363.1 hypothetical protein MIND_00427500 [Mycena indigotica]